MFERFTQPARESVVHAQVEARSLRHGYIGTEHLLLGLLHEESSAGARALARIGMDLETARADVLRVVGEGPYEGHEKDAEARGGGLRAGSAGSPGSEAVGNEAAWSMRPGRGARPLHPQGQESIGTIPPRGSWARPPLHRDGTHPPRPAQRGRGNRGNVDRGTVRPRGCPK